MIDDDGFRHFAATLTQVLTTGVKLKPEELLEKQARQFSELVAMERDFRQTLIGSSYGPTAYEKFIKKICYENGNILTSRPYFRERQEVCIGPISQALKREAVTALYKYHFNYNFIAWLMKTKKWHPTNKLKILARKIEQLRWKILVENMPLAISQARVFWSKAPLRTNDTRFSFMDFVQIGADGMLSAIDKFCLPRHLARWPQQIRVWRAVAIGRMKGNFIEMFCVDPATKILTADLQWVRADSLKVGDDLVGFDDRASGVKPYSRRKYRKSAVTFTGFRDLPKRRISTSDGEVVVSDEHMFLCVGGVGRGRGQSLRSRSESPEQKGRGQRWVRAKNLLPGDKIVFLCPPWEEGKSFTHGYLRGIADGEGCVTNSAIVSIAQNPGLVNDEIGRTLKAIGFNPYLVRHKKHRIQNWCIGSAADALRFLGEVRPIRLLQKAERIYQGRDIARGRKNGKAQTCVEVVSNKQVGIGSVVTLETSTGTFISEGMLSHNSETSIHFYPRDKRILYNANKLLREFVGAVDFQVLADKVNKVFGVDGPCTTAEELQSLMSAAYGKVKEPNSEEQEEGVSNSILEKAAAPADWQPDVRFEEEGVRSAVKEAIFGRQRVLTLIEQKVIRMRGVDMDSI